MKTAIHHQPEPPTDPRTVHRKAVDIAFYAKRIIGPNKPSVLRQAMGLALASVLADQVNHGHTTVKIIRESLINLGDSIEGAAAVLASREIAKREAENEKSN